MINNILFSGCNGVMPSENRSCVCLNQELSFNCTINGTGITEWSGSFIGNGNRILLRHAKFENGTMGFDGQITARSIGVDNGCYSSQLTATATAAQNSTLLQCVHNLNEERKVIGTVSLIVVSGKNTWVIILTSFSHYPSITGSVLSTLDRYVLQVGPDYSLSCQALVCIDFIPLVQIPPCMHSTFSLSYY